MASPARPFAGAAAAPPTCAMARPLPPPSSTSDVAVAAAAPARRGSRMQVLWARTRRARKKALMHDQRTKLSQCTAARAAPPPQGSGPGPRASALAARKAEVPRRVASSCAAWAAKTWRSVERGGGPGSCAAAWSEGCVIRRVGGQGPPRKSEPANPLPAARALRRRRVHMRRARSERASWRPTAAAAARPAPAVRAPTAVLTAWGPRPQKYEPPPSVQNACGDRWCVSLRSCLAAEPAALAGKPAPSAAAALRAHTPFGRRRRTSIATSSSPVMSRAAASAPSSWRVWDALMHSMRSSWESGPTGPSADTPCWPAGRRVRGRRRSAVSRKVP
jgi:hypothetical protein